MFSTNNRKPDTALSPDRGKISLLRANNNHHNKNNNNNNNHSHNNWDLSIRQVNTTKDDIEQPPFAKHDNMYIPPIGSSVIICGKSGCGKSTLLANFMTDSRFYGPSKQKPNGWFDKVFLFSPTANGDDIQRSLNIEKKYVFTDLEEAPDLLKVIIDSQQKNLDSVDNVTKVPQVCVIFDDVIGDVKFMNSTEFTKMFYQVRHLNCTTFLCAQHFKRVPRVCRLQANFIFFFQGSQTEVETIAEEFAPPSVPKKSFMKLVDRCTSEKFHFLTVNMKKPWQVRFRCNLDQIMDVTKIYDTNDNSFGSNNNTTTNQQFHRNWKHDRENEQATGPSGHRPY